MLLRFLATIWLPQLVAVPSGTLKRGRLSGGDALHVALQSHAGFVHDADASVAYNLSWGHTEDWAGALVDLDGLHGNLSEDPDFVDASDDGDGTNDDMRLDSGSPAIDAADPATSDPDGSTADMGAYGGADGTW